MLEQLDAAYHQLIQLEQPADNETEHLLTIVDDLRWYAERIGAERWDKMPRSNKWSFEQNLWRLTKQAKKAESPVPPLHEAFSFPNSSIIRRMSIKTQLNESMKDALKSGDEVRKRTVRMALAAVKQVEVDKRIELDDVAVMNLLQKEIKNRRESLEEAKKANRADLIEANEAEINVLQAFLPKAMSAEELRTLVQDAITETGATSPADMGKVMKAVMTKVAGRAPNDMVSATVRELLQK